MNYYKRHIGDYLKDTSHLTLLEHGIYTRLLDVYYTREEPIPDSSAARLIGAKSREELKALGNVLSEFFCKEGDFWKQKRCDEELKKKQDKSDFNKAIGLLGGRPKITQTVSENNPNGFEKETQTVSENNPSHKPITNNQEKTHGKVSDVGLSDRVDSVCPTPAGEICKAMREAGIQQVNPSHPTLLALIDAGATVEEFKNTAAAASKKNFAYILGVVKGQRMDAASLALEKSAKSDSVLDEAGKIDPYKWAQAMAAGAL